MYILPLLEREHKLQGLIQSQRSGQKTPLAVVAVIGHIFPEHAGAEADIDGIIHPQAPLGFQLALIIDMNP